MKASLREERASVAEGRRRVTAGSEEAFNRGACRDCAEGAEKIFETLGLDSAPSGLCGRSFCEFRTSGRPAKHEKVRESPNSPYLLSFALPDYFREATKISSVAGTF